MRTWAKKLSFLCMLMMAAVLSAQEAESGAELPPEKNDSLVIIDMPEPEAVAQKKHSIVISAGPALLLSTDSTTNSAPSPIMFAGGVGGTLFQQLPVSFQPRISFFMNHYLWDGEAARPAEIENRTAIVLSFLIDLNAIKIIHHRSHTFQFGGGIGFLARFAILANGIDADGGSNSNTAKSNSDDVSSTNSWFWSGAHFLYPDLMFAWLHDLPNGWKAGASLNVYIPVGSLADGRGADGMIIMLAARLEI